MRPVVRTLGVVSAVTVVAAAAAWSLAAGPTTVTPEPVGVSSSSAVSVAHPLEVVGPRFAASLLPDDATQSVLDTGDRAPAVTPCAPVAKACFSVSQRRAWLTDGAGHVTYGPVPALGGQKGHPTPVGTFAVTYKDAHHVSNLFSPGSMPYSVFFAPAVAFHQGSLAQSSHGCVHLANGPARTFFARLAPGDHVQVVP